MYGLLVENLASFVRIQWGESKWDMVRKNCGIDAPSFSIHHAYPETLLNKLAKSAFQVLGVDDKNFFEAMGVYFVEYVGQYGYDAMLTVLGRHMRDFLNGLDNLHEYLKFSYTKMRAPSFFIDQETATGLRLHYRSRRRGFVYYVMGQIKQVARHFYNQDCAIEVLSEALDGETMHIIFQLTFDNDAFTEHESLKTMIRKEQQLPIRASIIFELFPFCIVFDHEMEIKFTGHALLTILKDLVGQCMTEAFEIVKPLISFCFNTILERRNNIFELITVAPIKDDEALTGSLEDDDEGTGTSLRLRGQMMEMEEWGAILFLANPVMPDITSLVDAGLYINDLSLHDCSRDLVLAGTQQSVELKLALDQEQHKSKKLEESMKKLDEEMKRTDELLYQMIPKKVADRIREGENPADTCEVFECVSILFSDVVTFTDICSRINPMQVVGMLNHMYSLFDQLTERNGVYKVETIGDSYMVVSGAPEPDNNHAEKICDMAMDMVDAMTVVMDPSREGESLQIRVGCHSGTVVAGVVGVKMPRYCLFGDAVNTSSRMESTSIGGRIQISEGCRARLSAPYKTEKRGTVTVKGKGEMDTHWLLGRDNRVPLNKVSSKAFNWEAPKTSTKEMVMTKQISLAPADDVNLVKEPAAGGAKKEEPTKVDKPAPKPAPVKPVPKIAMPAAATSALSSGPPPPATNSNPSTTTAKTIEAAAEKLQPKNDPKPPEEPVKSASAAPPPNITVNRSPISSAAPSPSRAKVDVSAAAATLEIPSATPVSIRRSSTASNPEVENAPAISIRRASVSPGNSPKNTEVDKTASTNENLEQEVNETNEMIQITISNLSPDDIPIVENNSVNEDGIPAGGNERRKSNFMGSINGIRKGSEKFRSKIKDKKFSTVTVEAITDLGCNEFAAKQKEIISQACILL